ncbi:MAG: hypothetical protein CMF36_13925 [Leeuwenhoekiella sp.]|nr:hypothetical protein [Leeuwenhoekiella sp.]MBA82225.1 hypothetical protein [Leeuwenhoekiella sp.]|tara:strand:- start:153 stop:506 length:354 start_codon:yes stop_codon:yes gene_type:complete
MIKKIAKIIGLISFILSYGLLIWNMTQNGFPIEFSELLKLAWIFGVISLISNSTYVILTDLNQTLFSIFGFCGLIWFFPFLIDLNSTFGFPSLVGYLIIGIYLHFRKTDRKTVYNNI